MAVQVAAPARKPRSGGIKDVVDGFVEESRLAAALADGGLAWESSGCNFPTPTRAGCYDLTDDDALDDVKGGDEVAQFTTIAGPFARYSGVECWIGGDSVGDTYGQQARALLEAGEDREVESALWGWAEAAPSPGSAASLGEAIGVAEEYADTAYIGRPVIVMSKGAAALAFESGALVREGGKLFTGNGNPVLATGVVPDEDEGTVVAIGQPAVYASPIVARMAVQHTENLAMAIAERVYAVGVDCDFRYAVTVTTTP